MKTATERFLEAIGYPERAPDGALSFTLQVDGGEIVVLEDGGRLRLVCRLTDDDSALPTLARFAAGRMLREDAMLAFGTMDGAGSAAPSQSNATPNGPTAFLWQDTGADADAHAMRRLFETFADSCDWWRTRTEELRGNVAAAAPEMEMMIRP